MAESPGAIWSLEWWISVVVFGLGVNLASGYLKPYLDRIGARISRAWATRSEQRALERLAQIDKLRCNEAMRQAATLEELRSHILGINSFLMSISLSVLGISLRVLSNQRQGFLPSVCGTVLLVLGALAMLRSISHDFDARRIRQELVEALKIMTDDTQSAHPQSNGNA
jgi:hypothetical protein